MRRLIVGCAMMAFAGCATSNKPATPWVSLPMCMPCTMPCTPDSCAPPKAPVAVAAAPAPVEKPAAPAPKPAADSPSLSPAPGKFTGKQLVTLSSGTPGAVIHYTTDGSPATNASPVYSGPIAVDKDMTINAIAVAPGAPSSSPVTGAYAIVPETPRVVVQEKRLELKEMVYFDTGKATIKPVSFGLLDEVATALNGRNEIKKVEVGGHTDSVGKAAFNKKLSQQRANSVKEYLSKKGVDPVRLDAKGYGQEKPVASNKTAAGREKNRRVEFNIGQ